MNKMVVTSNMRNFKQHKVTIPPKGYVGPMLRRRRSYRKKRSSAEAVCIRWPKVPLREASVLQTDLKIE